MSHHLACKKSEILTPVRSDRTAVIMLRYIFRTTHAQADTTAIRLLRLFRGHVMTTSPPIGSSPCLWQEGVGHMGRKSVLLAIPLKQIIVITYLPILAVSEIHDHYQRDIRTGLFRWYCCELSCSYRSTMQNLVSSLGSCMTCQSRVYYRLPRQTSHVSLRRQCRNSPPCLCGRRQRLQSALP